MNFSVWTISDFAAWWGAVIATLALAWNIIAAIRSGPRIKVRANPNMKMFPSNPIAGDKSYVSVTAVNKGNAPTTITHFCGFYSANLWDLIRGKKQNFIIGIPLTWQKIPFKLEPGEEWNGLADQQDMLEKIGQHGILYIGVIHNQRKRPVYVRVKLKT